MVCYILDMQEGTLRLEKRAGKLSDKSGREQEIYILSKAEFEGFKGNYPHQKLLNLSMEPVQHCKVETYSDCILGTMKIPEREEFWIKSGTFGFYLMNNQLLLIENEKSVRNIVEKMLSYTYGTCTLTQILLIIFERLIEKDVLYLQQLEQGMTEIEEEVLIKLPDHFNETIVACRKKLYALHTYYEQLMDIGDMMQTNLAKQFVGEDGGIWQLYGNRAERLHNHVEMLSQYLIQIRELYQSQIEVQQNRVMSFLTIVTTIFLPLSLIVGWYGMNFPNMPELNWEYGYPAVVIGSILIIFLEILYFKKKKML